MTKVAIKNENITSFGGIYHIMDVFSKLGLEKLTESVLGKRGSSGKAFSYGSILASVFFGYLCGGECLEDINTLVEDFRQRPHTVLPGSDTVGRGLKDLAEEIVRTVEERCNTFYIRASNYASRYEEFRQHEEWKTVEIGHEKCDVASVSMDDFIEGKSYRLVVQRTPLRDRDGNVQTDMFGTVYTYRCILTNDRRSTEKDIITFYNARGESEKNFDIQNNDFGWAHLPFSFLAENMAFMLVTAMLKNFYLYLVRHISEKVKPLKKTSRLKAFILHFVCVPAKWVRTGRQNVLNLYTRRTYYSEVFLE